MMQQLAALGLIGVTAWPTVFFRNFKCICKKKKFLEKM
jgi:hypothetical protein